MKSLHRIGIHILREEYGMKESQIRGDVHELREADWGEVVSHGHVKMAKGAGDVVLHFNLFGLRSISDYGATKPGTIGNSDIHHIAGRLYGLEASNEWVIARLRRPCVIRDWGGEMANRGKGAGEIGFPISSSGQIYI